MVNNAIMISVERGAEIVFHLFQSKLNNNINSNDLTLADKKIGQIYRTLNKSSKLSSKQIDKLLDKLSKSEIKRKNKPVLNVEREIEQESQVHSRDYDYGLVTIEDKIPQLKQDASSQLQNDNYTRSMNDQRILLSLKRMQRNKLKYAVVKVDWMHPCDFAGYKMMGTPTAESVPQAFFKHILISTLKTILNSYYKHKKSLVDKTVDKVLKGE